MCHVIWDTSTKLPTNLMGMQGGVHDGSLWVMGGYTGKKILTDVLHFSFGSRRWHWSSGPKTIKDFGSDDSGTAILDGVLYVVGGIRPTGDSEGSMINVSSVISYDIETGEWSEKSNMPTARRGLNVAPDPLRQGLYAVGGMNCGDDCYGSDVKYLNTLEMYYSRFDSWVTLRPMKHARRDAGVALIDDHLYAVGGCSNSHHSSVYCQAMDSVEKYSTISGKWKRGPTLNVPRHGFGLGICEFDRGTAIVVFGGSDQPGVMNNPTPLGSTEVMIVWKDGREEPWTMVGDMQIPRYGLLKGYGLALNGEIYAVGGSTTFQPGLHPSDTVEKIHCDELLNKAGYATV